jgi:hypothetical protein
MAAATPRGGMSDGSAPLTGEPPGGDPMGGARVGGEWICGDPLGARSISSWSKAPRYTGRSLEQSAAVALAGAVLASPANASHRWGSSFGAIE